MITMSRIKFNKKLSALLVSLIIIFLGVSGCKKKTEEVDNTESKNSMFEKTANRSNISEETKELIENKDSDNKSTVDGQEVVVNVTLDENGNTVKSIHINDDNLTANDNTSDNSSMNESLSEVYKVIGSLKGKPCIDIIKNTIDKHGINGIYKGYIEHTGSHGEYKDLNPTPLHMAVGCEYIDLVNALLSSGADLTIENGYGETPIIKAEQLGNHTVIDLLYDIENE